MEKKYFLAFALLIFITGQAWAAEGTAGDYLADIGTKFGRGLWNVISSPAEIPCTMSTEISAHPAYGFFSGLGEGIAFMARRILVGVTEVGTFMIPMERTLPQVCQMNAQLTERKL